ncbi:uncharacterized protein LOC133476691 isoform X3 [Phyllopteryx taeniolatus]|uniref:uncharacterized protein LOC133476691 isoform X3 n=1 Tax=Phyllopteryx taeniolatus TaxID=161469 RepID=UPI002AD4C432|nr:uncharacterized protein LOC133476691 isoform X3 [Phyllopteryx taeniolatus]
MTFHSVRRTARERRQNTPNTAIKSQVNIRHVMSGRGHRSFVIGTSSAFITACIKACQMAEILTPAVQQLSTCTKSDQASLLLRPTKGGLALDKVIAIVMDLLTDLQILQDLMDAAWRRSVPIYILLDNNGVPHFLDMCSRLQIGAQHLRNIRARTLRGVGFNLSFGRLPGSMCSKYMLVDGDKVVFGSYSFSWCTSRMDRNTITVMTGQVVEFFDQDFRELYAVSEKLDLFREFHVSPPAIKSATVPSKVGPKRPPLPATTSRFQVTLGDARKADIEVPAHKYYNPKYFLLFPDIPHPARSLQGPTRPSELLRLTEPMDQVTSSEKLDRLSPLASETPVEFLKKPDAVPQEKKRLTLRQKISRRLSSSKLSINSGRSSPVPAESTEHLGSRDHLEVSVKSPPNKLKLLKRPSTLGPRTDLAQTVDTTQDAISLKSHHRSKQVCKVS